MNGVLVKSIKSVVGVLLAATSVFLLSSCSTVDSAASVGKESISVTTVENSVKAILDERAAVDTNGMELSTGAKLSQDVVRFHLVALLLQEVGVKYRAIPTEAQIATRRAAIVKQVGGEKSLPQALVGAGIAAQDFNGYVKTMLISERLGQVAQAAGVDNTNGAAIQALVVGMASKKGVVVNPRYGAWDAENANVIDKEPNTAVTNK
ncbi:unannotated protein [freshwater metagenome]|uniref:Unannotated protein n=2 Tax=freshwater metagenome TaxID=449393 RepID=A0A6J6F0R0_9ZZZZ